VDPTTVRAILDTSVLLAPSVQPLEGELAISAVSLADLQFGVLVTNDPSTRANRLRRLTEFQRRFTALPIDDSVAASYGQLAAAVSTAGRRVRATDLLVAATAHAHRARLYTRNAVDLAGLEDLIDIVEV
jgi:toxin FitB